MRDTNARRTPEPAPYIVLPNGRALTEDQARAAGLHLDTLPLGQVTSRELDRLMDERERRALDEHPAP